MNRPYILGIPTDPITFEAMLQQIGQWIANDEGLHQICTVNPEFVMIAQRNREFFDLLQQTDLNVLDGWGVVWALRLRGIHVPERVTGSDGVPMIVERAAQMDWRVYLLGAAEGVAAEAAAVFRSTYPNLQIAGTYAGSPHPDEAQAIIDRINQASTDILLVAYGAPNQDLWIHRYREQLHVKVALGVGGVFDFITGRIPRAPAAMRRWGIEWLYRLYLQPTRWRRMLRLPLFAILALILRDKPYGTND